MVEVALGVSASDFSCRGMVIDLFRPRSHRLPVVSSSPLSSPIFSIQSARNSTTIYEPLASEEKVRILKFILLYPDNALNNV